MAHFAELDTRNNVLRVIVVGDEDSGGGDLSSENVGIGFSEICAARISAYHSALVLAQCFS